MSTKRYAVNSARLRGLRAEHNITQREAGKILGISHVSYARKERGDVQFTPEEITKLAQLFDLSLDDANAIFFGGNLPSGKQCHTS